MSHFIHLMFSFFDDSKWPPCNSCVLLCSNISDSVCVVKVLGVPTHSNIMLTPSFLSTGLECLKSYKIFSTLHVSGAPIYPAQGPRDAFRVFPSAA